MAGDLRNMLVNARCCYAVTKSIRQTLLFVLAGNSGNLMKIRLKTGTTVFIRRSKTDRDVFLSTFYNGYHRIRQQLKESPVIVDLGSNIGLTIVDYLEHYPCASITGVEMDAVNFEIAIKNTSNYPNVSMLQKAVWKKDEIVGYSGNDTQSYSIDKNAEQKIVAVSMETLLAAIPYIDLVKMDIEGAEYAVLLEDKKKSWLRKTKYLNIEVHNTPKQDAKTGIQKIISVLEEYNFDAVISDNHWSSVIAVNKELP